MAGRGDHAPRRRRRGRRRPDGLARAGSPSAASSRSRTATRAGWCGACATAARCAAASAPSSAPRSCSRGCASTRCSTGATSPPRRPAPARVLGDDGPRVVAIDCGMKESIARGLVGAGCRLDVVPAGITARRGAGARPRRGLPLQRPGRPGGGHGGDRDGARAARRGAGLRHLPRPPDARAGARAAHAQAGLRPPGGEPPGAPLRGRPGGDHGAEPRLRGGGRRPARRRLGHAHEPLRRLGGGHRRAGAARLVGAVPPRGEPRAARRALHVPRVRRRRSAGAPANAAPRRPLHDHGARQRPADRDRPGRRVRLLRHPGRPGAARGGLPGGPGQLQPGHDHDRPLGGRPHLRRAARRASRSRRSSRWSARTPCCRPSAARPPSTWRWT